MKKSFKLSGIRYQTKNLTLNDIYKEEFDRKGYVVIKNIFSLEYIKKLQVAYDASLLKNEKFYLNNRISLSKKERGIIRQIYRFDDIFLESITKKEVTELVDLFIDDSWIITQQNGSHVDYQNNDFDSVGVQVWHRDFVYRHITTSKPLLINILVPLDNFSIENGATNVLHFSHLFSDFPSNEFVESNLSYAIANAGDIIILNGLTYHSAGLNINNKNRRSFNTVFAVPLFRHQVDPLPINLSLSTIEKFSKYLTAGYLNNPNVLEYVKERNA